MPDGLYLTDDEYGFKPFLIIEGGRWIDPYEWVKQHGILQLNRQFTAGKRFERIHLNAHVASVEQLNLRELTLKDVLAQRGQTEWAGGMPPAIAWLAPQIVDQQCERWAKEKWDCKSGAQVNWLMRCQAPSSRARDVATVLAGRCLAGITVLSDASKGLGWRSEEWALTPIREGQQVERQMGKDYRSLGLPVTKDRDFSNADFIASYVGGLPTGHRIVAGSVYNKVYPGLAASRARHMDGRDLTAESIVTSLGYVYDMQDRRYVYIQQPKTLSPAGRKACEHGGEGTDYCPSSLPVGIWVWQGKLHILWRHDQRLGTHYQGRKRCKEIEGSGRSCPGIVITALSFTVTQHDMRNWTSQEVYSTRPTLSTEQQF
jgi:hypothetical protein